MVDIAWVLCLLGVAVGLWLARRGWRGDAKLVAVKGLRRCSKCWHELGNIPTRVCPECGREAKSEAALRRPRKKRVSLAVGVVMAVGLGVAAPGYQVVKYGWWAVVPDTVLIMNMPRTAVEKEISRRIVWWEGLGAQRGALDRWPLRLIPKQVRPKEWFAPWQIALLRARLLGAMRREADEQMLRLASSWIALVGMPTADLYNRLLDIAEGEVDRDRTPALNSIIIMSRSRRHRPQAPPPPNPRVIALFEATVKGEHATASTRGGIISCLDRCASDYPEEWRLRIALDAFLNDSDFGVRLQALECARDLVRGSDLMLYECERIIDSLPSRTPDDRDAFLRTVWAHPELCDLLGVYFLYPAGWDRSETEEQLIAGIRYKGGVFREEMKEMNREELRAGARGEIP